MGSLILCFAIMFSFSKKISSAKYNSSFLKEPGAVAYNLNNPLEIHELPDVLKEVSGVADVGKNEVACVQDEEGIVFVYNLKKRKIIKQIPFGRDADYEGISYAEETFFVMRSNGILHEVNLPWDKPEVKTNSLKLPTWNNEGLCYDKKDNRLLIAPKSALDDGIEKKEKHPIYSYNLEKGRLDKKPLFFIKKDKILAFAKKYKLSIPGKKKSKKKVKFKPSSIAVHPFTDEVYVLSAKGNLLVVFDKNGTITGYARLNKKIFNHPEGLTFLQNGDMVVTNEGDEKKPTLLIFPWYKG